MQEAKDMVIKVMNEKLRAIDKQIEDSEVTNKV